MAATASRLSPGDERLIRAAMRLRAEQIRAEAPPGSDLSGIPEAVLLLERAGLRSIGCTAASMRDAELEQAEAWALEELAR